MNLADMAVEYGRLNALLDAGLDELRSLAIELANAENAYRKARSLAWPTTEGTAKEREDAVGSITADARQTRDIAEYKRVAALEAVRSRRTQISALQTMLNAHQAEAQLLRTAA